MTLVERGTVLSRINWGAVLAGLAAGAVTQLALSALGVAFGSGADSLGNLAIGTVVWVAISLLVSAFVAGLVAARAAGYLTPAQGRFNGFLTGALLSLLTTLLLSNALTAGFRTAGNILGSAANAAGSAAGGAADSGALQSGPVQAVLNGLNEDQIGEIIAEGSPELSEAQATAATRVVSGIVQRAGNDIGANLSNVGDLGQIVTRRLDAIGQALQGPQFVTRLQRQGLSQAQAEQTAQAISARATELRTQAEQAARQAETAARQAARTASWSYLLALGLILGAATLGGGRGADLPKGGALVTGADGRRDAGERV